MKNDHLLIFFLYITISPTISGQETKNHLTLSGNFSHFINCEDDDLGTRTGYFKYAISPGMEIIYSRVIFPQLCAETGISFQWGRFSSNTIDHGQHRFNSYELSVPLYLKKVFLFNNGNLQYFTSGVYLGKIIKVIGEFPDSQSWQITKPEYLPFFSNNTFFSDLYLDCGYVFTRDKKPDISFAPFIKYRFNPTWLNHHESRWIYGIKIDLTLKL